MLLETAFARLSRGVVVDHENFQRRFAGHKRCQTPETKPGRQHQHAAGIAINVVKFFVILKHLACDLVKNLLNPSLPCGGTRRAGANKKPRSFYGAGLNKNLKLNLQLHLLAAERHERRQTAQTSQGQRGGFGDNLCHNNSQRTIRHGLRWVSER